MHDSAAKVLIRGSLYLLAAIVIMLGAAYLVQPDLPISSRAAQFISAYAPFLNNVLDWFRI